MKNFTCLICTTFLIQISSFAQPADNYYGAWELNHLLENAKPYSKPEIAEVKFSGLRNGKLRTTIYKFNEDGKIKEYFKSKKNEAPILKSKVIYDENKKVISAIFYDKNKLDFQYSFLYNDKGKVTELTKTNDEGELKLKKNLKFDSNEDLIEQSYSYKKSGEINSQWKYEYFDKGKLSHTYYYRKGKLKREWDYMCKEEGEEITKKDLFKVCQFHETNGDTLTTIYQTTNPKGKIVKTVYKMNAKDSLPFSQLWYNDKNQLTAKFTYDKSYTKMTSQTFYKKGKPVNQFVRKYTDDKIMNETSSNKRKTIYSTEYSYNEEGYLTATKSFGKNNKFKGETKIEYTFR